ncbi:carboxymuconolactone decarboxylase family protein [Solicola gregarius]|uniref:Carboxymuconolactone decarboxylase family protein n=1 Tax=Solicola gregarius TaxID=2908642 RepID=A0AA46YLC7_9ACTN|nr:carboxymuconolactone decarboxylase family protein [Solicola gregarius]UYM05381.1 carboxymuconolactone decarboxylase family protein [Solicola gregarius]
MTAPRIAPGSRREIGLVNHAICWVSGRVTGTNPPNLFTTLGRSRGLFRGWMWYSSKLMPFGRLSRRETELLILRIAHLRESEYEFTHHVRIGRRAGVRADDVERVKAGPDADGWSERERVLVRAIDELDADRDISDATWAAMCTQLSEQECIEVVMLSGQYESLATAIATLRIQTDR